MTRDGTQEGVGIVLVGLDEATQSAIEQHLSSSIFEVIGDSPDPESGRLIVSNLRPDIVFMAVRSDGSAATFDVVRRIREELPSTGVAVLSYETSPQLILSSMRAGAQEFLTLPLDTSELDGALGRLQKVLGRTKAAGSSGGRIYASYASKGGVGASSLATNLALALKGHTGGGVVLVDFNLQVGDLALMLDMNPKHSFASAIGDDDIDEVKLRSMLAIHASGLCLLTVADRPEESGLVRQSHVAPLFELLRGMFEHIVVDLGRHIDDRTIELLDLSDVILLVSALDVPTIRNTKSYLDLFGRLEIAPHNIRLVVNRLEDGKRISNRDLVRAVGREIYHGLPNDYASTSASIDSGNPVVLNSPRSKLAASYQELARALTAPSQTGAPSRSATPSSTAR
jgi:pilus assembly protein CpaE